MYILEITFECYQNTNYSDVERSINNYFDMLRYNGQILGREFPIAMFDGWFTTRLVSPETDSLSDKFNSVQVKNALSRLTKAGLLSPKIKVIGEDLNSLATAENFTPSWQILYTTFLDTCSPLRSGDDFSPIPLYRTPEPISNGDRKSAIKWQEEWINSDELQMNGSELSHKILNEIGSIKSKLFNTGSNLSKRIEFITKVPTYYYLYRVAGTDLKSEQDRKCPSCNCDWKLEKPVFDIFDFKCDKCQLVSNISWDFKK